MPPDIKCLDLRTVQKMGTAVQPTGLYACVQKKKYKLQLGGDEAGPVGQDTGFQYIST